MNADPRDDFTVFAGVEHMFYGLADPFGRIRREIERILYKQVPDCRVLSIRAFDVPKWLTLGRKLEHDPERMVVAHTALCFRCTIEVKTTKLEHLDATMTMMHRDIDRGAEGRSKVDMHFADDAEPVFAADAFESRFLKFRNAGR